MNRRSFFQRLGAALGIATVAQALPPSKTATGGLFNPKANIYEQFFGKGGARERIGTTIHVRKPPRLFYNPPPQFMTDEEVKFLHGYRWTSEELARRTERVINLIDPNGTSKKITITINEGL